MKRLWIGTAGVVAAVLLCAHEAPAAGRCGDHPWCDTALSADERAALLLDALTMEEKVSLLAGDDLFGASGQTHTGTSNGVARVELPTIYYGDGPMGSRQRTATAMPAPIGLAATWDPITAELYGAVIADEVKKKGNDVVFAPTINIMRTPLGGRTFEGYGEDPFLVSRIGVGWIRGAQAQGVIGCVKHYAANNQEGVGLSLPGLPLGVGVIGNRLTVDAVVDERTLREVYLPAFEAAVREANVGSVMCSYNRLNGAYACENEWLLEHVLRDDWGFEGYVLSDYLAAHPDGTARSLENGLDFEPWPGISYSPLQVNLALLAGLASPTTVDSHVGWILRTHFAYGAFDRDGYVDDDDQIDKAGHLQIASDIEEQAITLLENRGALPIGTGVARIAVIGAVADTFQARTGSAGITPFPGYSITPLSGIRDRAAAAGIEVVYHPGDDRAAAAAVAASADVALVFVADTSGEGADKPCLHLDCGFLPPPLQDHLIEAVAEVNPNTVVVLETGGPVLTPWRDDVNAIVEAWIPGVGAGTAIARVLFGDVDPGGRLPVTFPKHDGDLPTANDLEKYPGLLERVVYKEGLLVGYRWFDANEIEPAYAFGHGLSYTSFAYADLAITPEGDGAVVEVDVTNTGARAGVDVVQVYLGFPSNSPVAQPPKVLRGFAKVALAPGETTRARISLDRRAFSYWNTSAHDWSVAPGCYEVMVGRSSRNILASGFAAQGGASCGGALPEPALPWALAAGAIAVAACAARQSSRRAPYPGAPS